jgi:hypothetical protein
MFSLTNSVADNGGPVLALAKQRSGTIGGNTIVNSGDTVGQIDFFGSDGTEMVVLAEISGAVDGTPGANDMPGRLVFSTTADGAASPTEAMRINNQRELLIGTTTRTANGGVLQVSNGITFPATAVACTNANTLDDYEEGTWTPALVGTTAVAYNNQLGKYVKIGKMVHVQALLQTSSQTFTSTAATLQISGLPFTPNDNTGYYGTPGSASGQELNFDSASSTQSIAGDYLNTGISSNNIIFQITTKGTTRGEVRNLGFGTSGTGGCIVEFELTYYTTA